MHARSNPGLVTLNFFDKLFTAKLYTPLNILLFQQHVSQATQEIQQLKEQLSTETRLKAEAQEKTRNLETSLAEVKDENFSLKKDMQEHEEDWKNRLDTAEKKLAEVQKTYDSFTHLLKEIVAVVWGKLSLFFYISIIPIITTIY